MQAKGQMSGGIHIAGEVGIADIFKLNGTVRYNQQYKSMA